MEHAQRVFVKRIYKIIFLLCLNPYFNGTCSKRKVTSFFKSNYCVLILILMEHAQRGRSGAVRWYCAVKS